MRFDVLDELRQPGGRAVCELDSAPPEGLGVTCLGPVRGRIELTNVGQEIMARGSVGVAVELECMRCLRVYEHTLSADVEEPSALAEIDEVASYVLEGDEQEALPILEAGLINLSELVRQNLIVALPHRPLCTPQCKGLCPHCGQDLNEAGCDCRDEEIDPRLAPLRALLPGNAPASPAADPTGDRGE